ncbi:allergen Api m 6.03 / Api m 6.04-like [Phlebotomus argentipes]|uniref:allergen Api m 6.03 / Api m 6.04-like n=1 Tax=Phlebotomus argentipes TaxID=94469 RepID=UPI0028931C2A|nr:allergen Api m 6.03 / Api m 6.04-like [Phlebotomus argentipes]
MQAAVVFLALFGTLVSAEYFNNFPTSGAAGYNAYPNQLQCTKEYEYFEKCASPCEETCYNTQFYYDLKNKDDCSLRNCVPRCKCVSGYVRNNQEKCVPKSQCSGSVDFHHARGNRQPYFYPQQQYESQFENFQYGNQYDAGNYYNDYNKY